MINGNTRYQTNLAFRLIILMTAYIFFISSAAFAQNDRDFSTAQDVAIAFYKTGDTVPNFKNWVEETEPYKTTPLAKRPQVMETELTKLQKAYQAFSPTKDYLLLRTYVSLKPKMVEPVPSEDLSQENMEPSYSMDITFSNAPEALYFPYDFIGQRIAVMPYELDSFMSQDLSKEEHDFIQSKLTGQNLMVVRLKCRESDLSLPHKIDGIHQWVFKTEIASMEIWNNKGLLLWEYTAPWYITPTVLELKDLYEVGRGQN